MTFDQFLLIVHIFLATVWLGGGLSVTIVALRAQFSRDPKKVCRVGAEVEWFGSRVLMPSAVLVFLSGVALAWLFGSFQEVWVIISLAAFGLSAIAAVVLLGPTPGVLRCLIMEHGELSEPVQSRIRRHFLFNRIEVALLTVVLISMVLKPTL